MQTPRDIALKILAALEGGRSALSIMVKGEQIAKQGGAFGDAKNDTEIRTDKELGTFFLEAVTGIDAVGRISVEGYADWINPEGGKLWVTIDPLDGSLNYKRRRGAQGLPHSACITVLQRISEATFNDVIAAGVIEFGSEDLWLAWREMDGHIVTTLNTERASTDDVTTLDLGSQIAIGEFYYPENRRRLVEAFDDSKGWLRNPGSAAFEMALVSNGTSVAFICGTQKQHELGAGYLLVKGAGGVAVDFDGKDLGPRTYDFKTQTPVILAANATIAEQLVARLRTN